METSAHCINFFYEDKNMPISGLIVLDYHQNGFLGDIWKTLHQIPYHNIRVQNSILIEYLVFYHPRKNDSKTIIPTRISHDHQEKENFPSSDLENEKEF